MYGGELCPHLQTTAQSAVCISDEGRFQGVNQSPGKKSQTFGKEKQERKGRTAKGWLWHKKTALPCSASRMLVEKACRELQIHPSAPKCFYVKKQVGQNKTSAQEDKPNEKELHLAYILL